MELLVWPGDQGLPSMDLHSIQMMAYCKFVGAPVKVNYLNRTWNIFNSIPLFTHGFNVKIKSFSDLVAYLQRQNYNCDNRLTKKSTIDVQAYMSVISQKLEPALNYVLWAQEGNYLALTRPWYAKRLPFPASWVLPDRYQTAHTEKLIVLIGDCEKWPEKEKQLIEEAEKCLTLLSQQLGDQRYFFGDSPTDFDAYVYGYLACCSIRFPHLNPFQSSLNTLPNLQGYLSRIKITFFPDSIETPEDTKPTNASEFPNKKLDIALSVAFAATVMLSYAYIQLKIFKKL